MTNSTTIRKSNSLGVWISLPVVKKVVPVFVATGMAFSTVSPNVNVTRTSSVSFGKSENESEPFQTIKGGDTMSKAINSQSDNGNNDLTVDVLEFGKLMGKVDSLSEKMDFLIKKVEELPTKDWVEKQTLAEQLKLINKSSSTRLTIAGIIVAIVVPLVTLMINKWLS